MRLGVFGGAFDPVHFGHLLLAEQCREACALDEVWFIPTGSPPHKPLDVLSDAQVRVEMLRLATAGIPEFVVSRLEVDRPDISWTVDTLESLHAEHPEAELHLLIGADALHEFSTWRSPDRIAELAGIVAVNRGSRSVHSLPESLSETVRRRVQFVTIPGVDYSATEIRSRVRSGRSIRFMVPRAVEAVIRERGLYLAGESANAQSTN